MKAIVKDQKTIQKIFSKDILFKNVTSVLSRESCKHI